MGPVAEKSRAFDLVSWSGRMEFVDSARCLDFINSDRLPMHSANASCYGLSAL